MAFRDKAIERASRVRSIGVATVRANAGEVRDIVDVFIDHYVAGADISVAWQAAQDAMLSSALARYQPKIEAALARAGVRLDPSKPFTLAALIETIEDRSGLKLATLTPDAILEATDASIAKKLSQELNIPIASVRDMSTLQPQIDAAIVAALRDGTLERLLTKGARRAVRAVATWKRYGVNDPAAQRKIRQAFYQKRYARTHRQVWD